MYKVYIRVDMIKDPIVVYAKKVDTNSVPFVHLMEIDAEFESVFPYLSDIERDFLKDTKSIRLPFAQVILIKELKSEKEMKKDNLKVVQLDGKDDRGKD